MRHALLLAATLATGLGAATTSFAASYSNDGSRHDARQDRPRVCTDRWVKRPYRCHPAHGRRCKGQIVYRTVRVRVCR